MESDFRALVAVMVIGIVVLAISTTLLVFAFRAFGSVKPGEIRHIVLLATAVGFVLLCTLALLMFALR